MNFESNNYKVSDNGSDIADVFLRLFVNRMDTYAVQKADGSYVRVPQPLTKEVVQRHFIGEITVGAYMINPQDQTTKTLCFDVDPEHVGKPEEVTANILKACNGRFPEKAVLLEASRYPDPSFHIWVFFEPPIPAKAARFLGRKILEHAGVAVELFPKQDEVAPGEFGNLVKLPLGLHRAAGKYSCFLNSATFKPLNPRCLFDVEGCSLPEKDIQRAMELADQQQGIQTKLEPTRETVRKGVEDLFTVPCVKAFRDNPIPPGKRHLSYAKNIAVLYRQLKGSFDDFRDFAVELVCNQELFKVRDVMGWMSWAVSPGQKLNCEELRRFLLNYVPAFTCEGCPIVKGEPEPLELIQAEIEQQRTINLHPLIDYYPETGLTLGTLLGASQKSLIIIKEKPILTSFGALLIREEFPNNISVRCPSYCLLQPIHNSEILLVSRELLKRGKIENPASSEVFQKILYKEGYYWWHSDKRTYILWACWIIGTYVFPMFNHYPALHPQGERESGKTVFLDLICRLAWNPTSRETALRAANLYRTIEGSRGTYVVDVTKLDPRSPFMTDIIDIFETGTERGGSVRRCDPETLEPRNYSTYGPKVIASREELPFEAKCIRIITEKAKDPVYSKRCIEIDSDPEMPKIVGDIIRCVIKVWPEILEAYKAQEQTDKLKGRRFNYWAPLLAICQVFAPENYADLLSLAEEDAERVEAGDRMSEVEDAVLTILQAYEGITISLLLKDLTDKVQSHIPWVQSHHPVRSAITNLGIVRRKYQTAKGVAYNFDLECVRKKAQTRGVVPEETPSEEAEAPSERETKLNYGVCEVCGKSGASGVLRGGRWRYVHDECKKEWEGPL
ncbi:MAG: hypothetical protein QHH12_04910 [Candidatus Bathyarchaeota archaeon]|jgi:hypothetical protein|nr:hypothetical protein [Candidatus Bathyarchaeota archaeon A05DMB-3]MDH7607090.1 hypothetical protein [Candidatus Bathyarchaeota archaeon]